MASLYPRDKNLGFADTIAPPEAAKNELVLHLIEDELGEQTRRVAALLLSTYHCTLAYICRHFHHKCSPSQKLSTADVRRNLLMLQQHRCLKVERPPINDVQVDGPRGGNQVDNTLLYSVDTDMVVNRIRAGRLLYRAREASRGFNIPAFVPSAPTAAAARKATGTIIQAANDAKAALSKNDISSSSSSSFGSRNVVPDRLRKQQWEDIGSLILELLLLHGRATLELVLQEVSAHVAAQANSATSSREHTRSGDTSPAETAEAQAETALRKEEGRFLAYHIFAALIQQRLISRAKKLMAPRQQAVIKHKTSRGPKLRAGAHASAEDMAYVGSGRVPGGPKAVGLRHRSSVVEDDEEDNQLPDEMLAASRDNSANSGAPASLRGSTAAAAGSAMGAAQAARGGAKSEQVDRYAVIEARPEDSDGEERKGGGFGPISEEKLVDTAVRSKRGPKTLAVAEQGSPGTLAHAEGGTGAIGKRLRRGSGQKSGIDSDSEEEEETAAVTKRKPRKGSSSSMDLDEEFSPSPSAGKGKATKAPAKKRVRTEPAAAAASPAVIVLVDREPEPDAEDAADLNSLARKDVLWAVNWDQLFEEERIGVCVRYTRERLKEKAARVLRIMLEDSLKNENAGAAMEDMCYLQRYTPHALSPPAVPVPVVTGPAGNIALDTYTYNELPCINVTLSEDMRERLALGHFPPIQMLEVSRPANMMRIINNYARLYVSGSVSASNHESNTTEPDMPPPSLEGAEKVLDLTTLQMLLNVLVADTSLSACRGYNTSTDGAKGEYVANTGSMISILQRKTIHSIAKARYGVQTARLVELMLSRDEWMEQTVLGDIAILPAREAREKLYLLYRDKWVDFREISKRSDYNPQSTYYFWRVDYTHLRGIVLEHSYRGILNLHIKRASLLREVADKDLESQALALYAETSQRSTADGAREGDKSSADAAMLTSSSISTTTSSSASVLDTHSMTLANSSATTSESVAGNLTSGSTAIKVDGAAPSSAAMAIYRGSIIREEEKRLQDSTGVHRGANSLGMDVAIGRLDLAMHNLDLTIMLLDRFQQS